MVQREMRDFIQQICDTWPNIREQWQSGVYAETLQSYLVRVPLATARAGLFRWAEQHNKPPTVYGLLGAIDQVRDEERRREARAPVELPELEHVAPADRDVAKQALEEIHALLDKKLAMVPTGGFRRTPEEIQAYIREKGLTQYAGKSGDA